MILYNKKLSMGNVYVDSGNPNTVVIEMGATKLSFKLDEMYALRMALRDAHAISEAATDALKAVIRNGVVLPADEAQP